MRVVLDPGVVVSAALSEHGPPVSLLRLWGDGAFELVVSPRLPDIRPPVLTPRDFLDLLTPS